MIMILLKLLMSEIDFNQLISKMKCSIGFKDDEMFNKINSIFFRRVEFPNRVNFEQISTMLMINVFDNF